jgi:hypothetical protein
VGYDMPGFQPVAFSNLKAYHNNGGSGMPGFQPVAFSNALKGLYNLAQGNALGIKTTRADAL